MRMASGIAALGLGMGLLGGCAYGPLTPRIDYTPDTSPYPGWGAASPRASAPLARVLFSADGAPNQQGLLYTAMSNAQVAASLASRALVNPSDRAVARDLIGVVLYALDPDAAPDWLGDDWRIALLIAGRGYGVLPAVHDIKDEVSDASGSATDAASRALACLENTEGRAERLIDAGQRYLAAGGDADQTPQLREIAELALELNNVGAGGLASAGGVREPTTGAGLQAGAGTVV
ncbi:MAG: hypothetical protein ACREH6_03910, partial [Geminicoccaceae bacterium]